MNPNERKEIEVQDEIIRHVDELKSFRFNAGAGAGKTWALIETLKYVAKTKILARNSSQKIVCITYTNVAVEEIKDRLGNSDVVMVSTIHERLWQLIKLAQPELVLCHKEKIQKVLVDTKQSLTDSTNAAFYKKLNPDQKKQFIQFVERTKDIYYQCRRKPAAQFKSTLLQPEHIPPDFLDSCLKNVTHFKSVVNKLLSVIKLEACLERISNGKETRVNYDSRVNTDRLHRMQFSHDTLLEYGLKLATSYSLLCRIIIDSYPYFFIDEYQDTHENVVKFVNCLQQYANEKNKTWMVGYFGDTAQNIYGDGVGHDISKHHNELSEITKKFNRRSHKQIISIANAIRADEIVQEPIFENRNQGSVKFFYHNGASDKNAITQQFLKNYKCELDSQMHSANLSYKIDTSIHCLVLTNKFMAELNGFGDVYNTFDNSTIFFDNLSTQALSQQLEKLHPTILTLYHIVKLHIDIQQGKVSYYDIFGSSGNNMSFANASRAIHYLQSKTVNSLNDWVILIANSLDNKDTQDSVAKIIINRLKLSQYNVKTGPDFESSIQNSINSLMNDDSEEDDVAAEKIGQLLSLSIASLAKWVSFIDGIEKGDIHFHTYHGTKGEEYENVAIIMEHDFGKNNRNKFKNYFKHLQAIEDSSNPPSLTPDEDIKHINTKNLLYVACSRAIRNLRVLYLNDVSEIQTGIESIFGNVSLLETEIN